MGKKLSVKTVKMNEVKSDNLHRIDFIFKPDEGIVNSARFKKQGRSQVLIPIQYIFE